MQASVARMCTSQRLGDCRWMSRQRPRRVAWMRRHVGAIMAPCCAACTMQVIDFSAGLRYRNPFPPTCFGGVGAPASP